MSDPSKGNADQPLTRAERHFAALKVREFAAAEKVKGDLFRHAFQDAYKAKPIKNGHRNFVSVLRASQEALGQPPAILKAFLDEYGDQFQIGAHRGVFDHGEIWGIDRKPTFLIGHPYGIDSRDRALLRRIADLGLHVLLSPDSWYGFGTIHVRVSLASSMDPMAFATGFGRREDDSNV